MGTFKSLQSLLMGKGWMDGGAGRVSQTDSVPTDTRLRFHSPGVKLSLVQAVFSWRLIYI